MIAVETLRPVSLVVLYSDVVRTVDRDLLVVCAETVTVCVRVGKQAPLRKQDGRRAGLLYSLVLFCTRVLAFTAVMSLAFFLLLLLEVGEMSRKAQEKRLRLLWDKYHGKGRERGLGSLDM